MLQKVDLGCSLKKEEYNARIKPLTARLAAVQQRIKQAKIPVIMLFEGWGAAGKGSLIAKLIQSFDPRGYKVFSFVEPTALEKRRPVLARYWSCIPEDGNIAVFDRSWYREVNVDRIDNDLSEKRVDMLFNEINTMERQLTDGGYVILKFFLHISRGEQKKRFDNLAESAATSWRVTRADRQHNRDYELHYEVFNEMLQRSHTDYAPWHVIPSEDRRYAAVTACEQILERLEAVLAQHEQHPIPVVPPIDAQERFNLLPKRPLAEVDPNQELDCDYKKTLKKLQDRLGELHAIIYRERIPVVLVYEGWDAAGKGGNIKRVVQALDPRGYEVIPIAAPTPPELHHHYLWRFWNALPKTGHFAIYDRSWYGRLMVERIEGFCTESDWHRAFTEINEFERSIVDWGAVLLKFWVHIDADEQLRRFTMRQETPEKQWKITDEDWRNREKWPQYEEAINDMLKYTSTDYADWHIIESNNKQYARIKALRILIAALEERLGL